MTAAILPLADCSATKSGLTLLPGEVSPHDGLSGEQSLTRYCRTNPVYRYDECQESLPCNLSAPFISHQCHRIPAQARPMARATARFVLNRMMLTCPGSPPQRRSVAIGHTAVVLNSGKLPTPSQHARYAEPPRQGQQLKMRPCYRQLTWMTANR